MVIEEGLLRTYRLVIIVVYGHPQLILDFRGFPADLSVDVDVAVDYLNGICRSGNQSFDVVYLRLKRVFKYDDVPAFWLGELVKALEDKYSIAV